MKKYVLFLSLLLAVVPTYAVPTCSSQWHTGNLAHVYEETDVWYEFRAVGFGNNPGECLSSPFTCEIYQCGRRWSTCRTRSRGWGRGKGKGVSSGPDENDLRAVRRAEKRW